MMDPDDGSANPIEEIMSHFSSNAADPIERNNALHQWKQKSCAQPIMVYLYNDSNVNDDKDMCLRSLLLMDAKNFGG